MNRFSFWITIVLIAVFMFFLGSQYTHYVLLKADFNSRLNQNTMILKKCDEVISKEKQLDNEIALLENELEELRLIIPPEPLLGDFRSTMLALAKETKVELDNFQVSHEDRDFYDLISVSIELFGSDEAIGEFAEKLQKSKRLITDTHWSETPKGAKLRCNTYFYLYQSRQIKYCENPSISAVWLWPYSTWLNRQRVSLLETIDQIWMYKTLQVKINRFEDSKIEKDRLQRLIKSKKRDETEEEKGKK